MNYKNICIFLTLGVLSISTSYASAAKINREEAFIFFAEGVGSSLPESYRYIDLYYSDVTEDSDLGAALQKLIYLDLIKNTNTKIGAKKSVKTSEFTALANKILGVNIEPKNNITTTISINDLLEVKELYLKKVESEQKKSIRVESSRPTGLSDKEKIFFDVKKTLEKSHYDREDFSDNELLDAAIQGLTNATNDTYTTYFPPSDSKNFFTNLDGEYEGIGAYVDMPSPGEFIIVTPISGSPSDKAGLKGGDRVLSVDGKEITQEISSEEVISWIKGPKGTSVILEIEREGVGASFEVSVTRERIVLKDIEYEKLDTHTVHIKIKNFGDKVTREFIQNLETLKEDEDVKKIIFDLRNNPGGYLDEVANMLGYFVPDGEPTAIISYGTKDAQYPSSGKRIIDLNNYEVIFLQNSGTASASEIMIGTLKDYYPNSVIIGEKSFGKGSVQSLKNYRDGSTLKFTTAKWYTGKTRTGIDGVGISPDIEVEFDTERFETYKIDSQLEAAIEQ